MDFEISKWELSFLMSYRVFHKYVEDKYIQLLKRKVCGRGFEQLKYRYFWINNSEYLKTPRFEVL